MQTFIDTATQKIYAFNDDVNVIDVGGVYSFTTAAGMPLKLPATLQPYTAPAPTAAQLLADAKTAQMAPLSASYQSTIYADIQYTSAGGVAQTYQADAGSANILGQQLAVYVTAGAPLPAGYAWTVADNTQVPFTVDDLKGLAAAIGARGADAFFHLQAQKAAVRAATTIADVQAITW